MNRIASLGLVAAVLSACSEAPTYPDPISARTPGSLALSKSETPIAGSYIVVFKDDVKDVDAKAKELAIAHAGKVTHLYKSALKGMSLEISDAVVELLRTDPGVEYVEQDQTISINATQTGATWGIDRIDQRTLPLSSTYIYNADGTGVTVYIIDTGINFTHSEYNGRAFKGIDEITLGGSAADCNGHGSHVSGTVGGTTYGVAKQVKLVAVRVLNCSGSGSTSGVIAGIDWVTAQKNVNPSVPSAANMSLGGGFSSTLNQAVANSVTAGVVFAVAAGNDGLDACNYSPASTPTAITVGATDINDGFIYFSNRGSCVDINAPGVNITSAWIGSTTATNTISGTSMATPHVAGTVALYLQANPSATAAQVDAALKANASTTAVPAGTTNNFLYSGFISASTPPPPSGPVASFTTACTGFTCTFTNTSSNATAYNWNFGDNSPLVTTFNAAHTFAARSSSTVTLTATGTGGSNSTSRVITCNKRNCS